MCGAPKFFHSKQIINLIYHDSRVDETHIPVAHHADNRYTKIENSMAMMQRKLDRNRKTNPNKSCMYDLRKWQSKASPGDTQVSITCIQPPHARPASLYLI